MLPNPPQIEQCAPSRFDIASRLQTYRAGHDGTGERRDRCGKPRRDASLDDLRGRRSKMREPRHTRVEGLAERAATTQQQLQRDLEAVEGSRDPYTGPPRNHGAETSLGKMCVNDGGLRVEVEQTTHPSDERHQDRKK